MPCERWIAWRRPLLPSRPPSLPLRIMADVLAASPLLLCMAPPLPFWCCADGSTRLEDVSGGGKSGSVGIAAVVLAVLFAAVGLVVGCLVRISAMAGSPALSLPSSCACPGPGAEADTPPPEEGIVMVDMAVNREAREARGWGTKFMVEQRTREINGAVALAGVRPTCDAE